MTMVERKLTLVKSNSDKDVTRRFNIIFNEWKKKQQARHKGVKYFAAELGFVPSLLYAMRQGVLPLSDKVIVALIEKYNYSYEWIRNGTGDQIRGIEEKFSITDIKGIMVELDRVKQDYKRKEARMTGLERQIDEQHYEIEELKKMINDLKNSVEIATKNSI